MIIYSDNVVDHFIFPGLSLSLSQIETSLVRVNRDFAVGS